MDEADVVSSLKRARLTRLLKEIHGAFLGESRRGSGHPRETGSHNRHPLARRKPVLAKKGPDQVEGPDLLRGERYLSREGS